MNKRSPYVAPKLTVVTFKTEQGYANSDIRSLALDPLWSADYGDANLEDRQNAGNWGNSEEWF